MSMNIGRQFKTYKTTEKQGNQIKEGEPMKADEYIGIIKYLETGQGLVQVRDILKMLEQFSSSFLSDHVLELKYMANTIEFGKRQLDTIRYLESNTKLKGGNSTLMEIDLCSELYS